MNGPYSNDRGHVWRKNRNGTVDEFAAEWDDGEEIDGVYYTGSGHMGPVCELCGYSECMMCHPEPTRPCPGKQP